ncbi:polymorphic outer membrane protein, partial [Chlamydia psittaci 09DC78]
GGGGGGRLPLLPKESWGYSLKRVILSSQGIVQ